MLHMKIFLFNFNDFTINESVLAPSPENKENGA